MAPWGRIATLGFAVVAVLAGQLTVHVLLSLWHGRPFSHDADFLSDGSEMTLNILVSTPVQVAILTAVASRSGTSVREYLGWVWPRRGDLVFGIAAVVAFVIAADLLSWLTGHDLVSTFQSDIYRSASGAGWLALLWFAVLVIAPVGEEVLFRGFLFRGWLRSPGDVWPVLIATSLLFALMHVQYDWFVTAQVFGFALLLGWIRWASGSTILTVILHAIVNFEGMLETMILHG